MLFFPGVRKREIRVPKWGRYLRLFLPLKDRSLGNGPFTPLAQAMLDRGISCMLGHLQFPEDDYR